MAEWFVYVVTNPAGVAYTGITTDVRARVDKHNVGTGAKFTRGRGPWRIVHVEGPFPHGDALRREMAIKRDAAFKADLKAGQAAMAAADFHRDADSLPAVPGAYVLLLELAGDVAVHLPRQPVTLLPAGRYLYCGSAHGPGGIKARVARHMRRDKAVRWHIDHPCLSADDRRQVRRHPPGL
jgi:putative endonuclease